MQQAQPQGADLAPFFVSKKIPYGVNWKFIQQNGKNLWTNGEDCAIMLS